MSSINLTSRQSVVSEASKLTSSAVIELYILDATPIGGEIFYFYCGTNNRRGPLVYQGITYDALPVRVDGFQYTGKGEPPRPHITFSNVLGFVSALVISFNDLAGARLIRRRTFSIFLDGQPEADPNACYPDDIFYIDRKVAETKTTVEFELGISIDVEGVSLPRRQVLANICTVNYRGPECGFAENRVVSKASGAILSNVLRYTGVWSSAGRIISSAFVLGVLTTTNGYILGDGVLYDADGNERYFYCRVELMAPSSTIPPSDTNWAVAQWYRGAFNLNTTYQPNDVFYITRPGANFRRYFIVTTGSPIQGVQPPNTTFYTEDFCSKRLVGGCKLHFDPLGKGLHLPYGGFPGTNQQPLQ